MTCVFSYPLAKLVQKNPFLFKNSHLKFQKSCLRKLCGLDHYGKGTYTAEGITAIADALRVGALTKLDIQGNRIGSDVAIAIASAIDIATAIATATAIAITISIAIAAIAIAHLPKFARRCGHGVWRRVVTIW